MSTTGRNGFPSDSTCAPSLATSQGWSKAPRNSVERASSRRSEATTRRRGSAKTSTSTGASRGSPRPSIARCGSYEAHAYALPAVASTGGRCGGYSSGPTLSSSRCSATRRRSGGAGTRMRCGRPPTPPGEASGSAGGSQVSPEADLSSVISDPAVTAPPHRLVESDPSLVAFHRPQYRLVVAIRSEMLQSE